MKYVLIALLGGLLTGCASSPKKYSQGPDEVSIMAYNVENLFDSSHDKNREDHTYLPLSLKKTDQHKALCEKINRKRYKNECLYKDWSEKVVNEKLRRIGKVIKQVNSGRGPDILILEEVENISILNRLKQEHLKDLGYKEVILIEGPDKRGIDIGIMSKLSQLNEPKLHKIPYNAKTENDKTWMARSRGILQGDFVLPNGTPITVFGVHFPSQGNPSYWRAQAIDHLNLLKSQVPKNHIVVAGGDFNISKDDDQKNNFYRGNLAPNWLVSHFEGCGNCKGTNYYHRLRQWSFLDALLFDPELKNGKNGWKLVPESISIPNETKYQSNRHLSPARFSEVTPVGVSDHWPIYGKLKRVEQTTKDSAKSTQ